MIVLIFFKSSVELKSGVIEQEINLLLIFLITIFYLNN